MQSIESAKNAKIMHLGNLALCGTFAHVRIRGIDIIISMVLVYSGHPSDAAKWLLYTGGLLIEVFNVYVVHGKFRWDLPY